MTHKLFCLLLVSCFLISVNTISTYEIFQNSCQIPIDGYLFCSFSVNKNWDFLKFREWIDGVPGDIKLAELYISCETGASVFLPWPMRARSLKVLDINNCIIRGFYDEYEDSANYTDSMVDLNMMNCVIEENQNDHIDRTLHRYPSESFACGQKSVVVVDIRNLTSTFPRLPSGPKMDQHRNMTQTKCTYNHLIHYEETFQYSQMENDSTINYYPVLNVATFSSNNLSSVPEKARNWPSFFPALKVLDLSNNSIGEFDFEIPNENRTLYVDLRKNSVVDVSMNMTSYLRDDRAVVIDLRQNPIRCSCNVLDLKEYLLQINERFPEWAQGTEVYCETKDQKMSLITGITMETCHDVK
ncbi:uncharacterized protein LOC133197038 [Saccostrea echinata]|uniref:uncharacterized protein LOC133197038 n=1 Tax=Saccostrea echinata TaxID=191078 RepID=UPI002A810967|nr:uncharacterized protein LOC133197038 [Saccostrea echinata]